MLDRQSMTLGFRTLTRRLRALVFAWILCGSWSPVIHAESPVRRAAPPQPSQPKTSLNNRLLHAIELGDLVKVKALLAQGASPNAKDQKGVTALMRASGPLHLPLNKEKTAFSVRWNGLMPILKLLLSQGAQVNARDQMERTALIIAADKGHQESVEILLSHGADINAKDKFLGGTPLMWAALHRNTPLMLYLLKKGADVNTPKGAGVAVLMIVVSGDGFGGDARSEQALQDQLLVKTLLDKGVDVNGQSNSEGKTVLICAASSFSDDPTIMKQLLQQGANVHAADKLGGTALMYASAMGNIRLMQTLIAAGSKVNARDQGGRTALVWAAGAGALRGPGYAKESITRLLLDHGADPNIADAGQWTPLLYIAQALVQQDCLPTLKLLLQRGANPDARNSWGLTPLMAVAGESTPHSHAAALLLLQRGTQVNAKEDNGNTALMEAARSGQTTLVKTLLHKGADAHARNKKGQTALKLAQTYKYKAVIALLKRVPPKSNANKGKSVHSKAPK